MKNYNNCESHKMGSTKIPSDRLWHERWPVWGYVGIESPQSSLRVQAKNMTPECPSLGRSLNTNK